MLDLRTVLVWVAAIVVAATRLIPSRWGRQRVPPWQIAVHGGLEVAAFLAILYFTENRSISRRID